MRDLVRLSFHSPFPACVMVVGFAAERATVKDALLVVLDQAREDRRPLHA